jgi:hypothetical protein
MKQENVVWRGRGVSEAGTLQGEYSSESLQEGLVKLGWVGAPMRGEGYYREQSRACARHYYVINVAFGK